MQTLLLSTFLLASPLLSLASPPSGLPPKSVDEILKLYVQALGGQSAIDRITTREIDADRHHGPKMTIYWEKPDKVLVISHGERFGYDGGGSGWQLSKKKKITKLPRGEQKQMEIDANPVRYAYLKTLYFDLQVGARESLNSQPMDVIISPNDLGSTKFYFDPATHLLVHIEDFGDVSSYYKHSTDLSDYKEVDGIKFPFRIVHTTSEPGVGVEDIRISKVSQNIELKADLFAKPNVGNVVLGGKR